MVDAGISAQAAIGGYEQAFGSKPRQMCVSIFGRLAAASGGGTEGGHIFIDNEGTATVTTNDESSPTTSLSATVSYGAGSITIGDVSPAGQIAGTWVVGTGDDKDSIDIFMAHGDFSTRAAAAYVAEGTGALPGVLNVTSINGGTVSFILSAPHEDSDDLAVGDGYKISLWAYARGGV